MPLWWRCATQRHCPVWRGQYQTLYSRWPGDIGCLLLEKFKLLVSAEQLGSPPAAVTKGRVTKLPHRSYGVRAAVLRWVSLPVPDGVPSPSARAPSDTGWRVTLLWREGSQAGTPNPHRDLCSSKALVKRHTSAFKSRASAAHGGVKQKPGISSWWALTAAPSLFPASLAFAAGELPLSNQRICKMAPILSKFSKHGFCKPCSPEHAKHLYLVSSLLTHGDWH